MTMNVYRIVWADDDIDDILDDATVEELEKDGFINIKRAHNGIELETILEKPEFIDAVIVDANFNETEGVVESERDTSGLDYARSLYTHKVKREIPFFIFTNRSDEQLKETYQHNKSFLADFPRRKRWFKKDSMEEYTNMFEEIKRTVDEAKSPNFILRNKYKYVFNAAFLIDGAEDLFYEFLTRDNENTLHKMTEPFIRVRRIIEKIFGLCEKIKVIPPVSDNTNGTAAYFVHNIYRIKEGSGYKTLYKMAYEDIIPKPLACALKYIVDITQDGAHSKNDMKLKVDEYFENTNDILLLKSVMFILMDVVKWFGITASENRDFAKNEDTLWYKCE